MAKIPVRQGSVEPDKRATFVAHLLADAILSQVLPPFDAAGIVALPVKGIVTAYELYDDVTERPITDIDLRVLPESLDRVADVVARERWDLLRHSKPYGNIVFRINGFCVDVEASVGPPGLCSLRIADMIARAERGGRRGYKHLRPETHDHAVLLCVNAFKDKLTYAAPWAVRDVERIAAHPALDPDRFIAHARSSRVLSIVSIVADWMARERDSVVWAEISKRIGAPPRPFYARLFRALVRRDDNSLAIRLLARAGSDSRAQQARALVTALLWEVDTGRKRSRSSR